MGLPGLFRRARISAMKSMGWWIRGELKTYIYQGGENWPALHPLSAFFKKKQGAKAGEWQKRRKGRETALSWLAKFARYRVDDEGTLLQIDFGKSKKGKPGSFDPALVDIVKRAEEGEKVHVTEAMRKFLAATRRKRPKTQISGQTYFPLRKTTNTLTIPKRPIFDPVWQRINARVPGYFEEKFWAALQRYEKGTAKS